MKLIENQTFEGERPLYCESELSLRNVKIGTGESSLKETAIIDAENCEFNGKYPFWECDGFKIRNCTFLPGARAALWYSRDLEMSDCLVEAPKMFREMSALKLSNVKLTHAAETLWHCSDVEIDGAEIHEGDYLFMHSNGLTINNLTLYGNYSFQYCSDVEISNSNLQTKDAFWETENVTVTDSVLNGEYLGWYSRNLTLIRCKIGGTQPLCYAEGLKLIDCTFEPDADLAFEYSDVEATVLNEITSVKNPRSGSIKAAGYGEIILDDNIKTPANCIISTL